MEFRILGPLEVVAEGRVLRLGGAKQRALLALLLFHANEPVSVDRIVDELWGERPPPTAAKNVQVYVSHLRKALGDGIVVTTHPGYTLRVAEGSLDAQRVEQILAAASGRPAVERLELLRAGLDLWRGPPLAELADLRFVQTEIGRLEELRLQLLKRRIGTELDLGRHEDVIVELEKLVVAHPLDEHLRGQLMLALYQSSRQADALAVYRDARRALTDELGLEPDEELRSLEQRILAHDPTLRPTPVMPESAGEHVGGRRRRRLPRAFLAGVALLAAAAMLATLLALAGDDPPPKLVVPANAIAVVDPEQGAVVAVIPVGRRPETVVAGAGAVWVGNVGDRTLSRIDPETFRVTKTVGLGFEPTDLAADAERVWVAGGYDHALWRVDRDGLARVKIRFVERVGPLPPGFERGRAGVTVGRGSVWLSHGDEVTEFDPDTGVIRRTVAAGGRWHREIALADRRVWVGVNNSAGPGLMQGVESIDLAADHRVDHTKLISNASEIHFASRSLWVAIRVAGAVWELDPVTGLLQRTIPVGNDPEGLVFHDDSLWITNELDATVRRVDARDGETELLIPIGHALEEVAVANGYVFVAVR